LVQCGKCAICGTEFTSDNRGTVLNVDHDHKTQVVRGLLCRNCNRSIEVFERTAEWQVAARAYLREAA
jgi:DNA-directed RNA polymerase subunit RPC12/RpoP